MVIDYPDALTGESSCEAALSARFMTLGLEKTLVDVCQ